MKERDLLNEILLKIPAFARLFRNNVGTGWVGSIIRQGGGQITLRNPRPLHAGLIEGSSDLIGWVSVDVTPEMVGKKIAIFAAIEGKADGRKPSPAQTNFLNRVKEAGGIAGVANRPEDVVEILNTKAG